MSAQYVLSRSIDPLFAVFVGVTATWVRIRREERERAHIPSASSSSQSATATSVNGTNAAATRTGEAAAESREPTASETWAKLKTRLGKVDVREWDFKAMWGKKDRWGIVDP